MLIFYGVLIEEWLLLLFQITGVILVNVGCWM